MKKFLFFVCLLLSSCQQYRVDALAVATQRPMTNMAQPTRTPVPTATIDYQKTAEVAQSTADEARRINAQATAQHEAILNQQALMTQVVEQQEFTKAQWTAQAAATVIPLTSTQQAAMNTQIPLRQTSVASQLTATEHAPTQIVALIRVANEKEYGQRVYIGQIVLMWTGAVLSMAFVLFLAGKWLHEDKKIRLEEMQIVQPVAQSNTYREDKGQGFYGIHPKKIIPCTREQFAEFAEAITQGTRTMKVNDWEGSDVLFTRDLYAPFHMWTREKENGFAVANSHNGLDPTEKFLDLLYSFLETGSLPTEYQFLETKTVEPENTL